MDKLYHFVSMEMYGDGLVYGAHGDTSGLYGNCTTIKGDVSGITGDCTKLFGDCTGIFGDLDSIPKEQRAEYNYVVTCATEVEVN
jgi:hypothetical protein